MLIMMMQIGRSFLSSHNNYTWKVEERVHERSHIGSKIVDYRTIQDKNYEPARVSSLWERKECKFLG
jgi:hypothetical protein